MSLTCAIFELGVIKSVEVRTKSVILTLNICAALDLLGASQRPPDPLRSVHVVPQYLAAPSAPSRTETFLHTKMSHPFVRIKNSAL